MNNSDAFVHRSQRTNKSNSYPRPGFVKLKWKHPLFPTNSKLGGFKIEFTVKKTGLIEAQKVRKYMKTYESAVPPKKEYEKELHSIYPSTMYRFNIFSINPQQHFSGACGIDSTTPSRIDFESADFSLITSNDNWIGFKVPAVTDATVDTWVTVTLEGYLNCTKNASSADRAIYIVKRKNCVVDKYKVSVSK